MVCSSRSEEIGHKFSNRGTYQMKKGDKEKVETAAEIYSKIKMKTMIGITASFFALMVLAFLSLFLKGV